MKIYISGKITGDDNAIYKFTRAEQRLKGQYPNAVIVNPLKPYLPEVCWLDFIILDIMKLSTCTHICLLPDYSESTGAIIESLIADKLGLETVFILPN